MKNFHTLLVDRGVASIRQVEEAMARQVLYGGDLSTYVLEQIGAGREEALNQALATHYELTAASGGPLPPPSPQAAQVVSRDLALRHTIYPLLLDGHALTVAVSSPLPEEVEADLFFVLGVPTRQLITSRIRIRQALARDFALPLEAREQRTLARIEGRPTPNPSTIPPPNPALPPPSLRLATPRLPAVQAIVGAEPGAPPRADEPRSHAWPQATRGLLRWMQRASQDTQIERPSSRRRRRGPMSVGACEEALAQAANGDEALSTFFDFAQQYFAYSALFIVQGDLAEGRDAYGAGADRERVRGVGVPLDLPSCLSQARSRGAPVSTTLRSEGLDASLASDLGRSPRGAVLVVPLLVRQRCVALFYADDGESSIELSDGAEVIAAASLAGATLERLALRRKRPASAAAATSTAAALPPAAPLRSGALVSRTTTLAGLSPPSPDAPLVGTQVRQQKAQALVRALGLPADLPRATAAAPTLTSAAIPSLNEDNPFRRITASLQPGEEVPPTVVAAPHARATSPSRVDEGPDVQVSEHDLDDDELVRAALQEMLTQGRRDEGYPMSERSSYHPPARPPSEHQQPALPSIIVDLDEQQSELLDRLVASSNDDDEVLSEILREGVRMVPALLARQPGPLRVPLPELLSGEVRPSQAGPLLRALVAMRRTALPFVVVQSASAQVEPRRLATLLLGEFPYAEAVQGLLPRFFDGEPTVQQAALSSARLLRTTPSLFDQLLVELRRLNTSPGETEARRQRARALLDALA